MADALRCQSCFELKGAESACPACGSDGTTKVTGGELPPGTLLREGYIVGRVLGRGGFGITYLAWDQRLERKRAVKEYFPQGVLTRDATGTAASVVSGQTSLYADGRSKYLAEARLLAQFENHPTIVSPITFFEANNTAYLVMEYLEGETLRSYVRRTGGESSQIPYAYALHFLAPVAEALATVHQRGILHRDVSPDNIFLTTSGDSKLIDFGAARQHLADRSQKFTTILRHHFAPPEQYSPDGKQGPWTDVYAFAATFYQSITGATLPAAMDRVLHDAELIPPSEFGVELPPEAEDALVHCLSVRPEDRPQRMEEVIEVLRAAHMPAAAPAERTERVADLGTRVIGAGQAVGAGLVRGLRRAGRLLASAGQLVERALRRLGSRLASLARLVLKAARAAGTELGSWAAALVAGLARLRQTLIGVGVGAACVAAGILLWRVVPFGDLLPDVAAPSQRTTEPPISVAPVSPSVETTRGPTQSGTGGPVGPEPTTDIPRIDVPEREHPLPTATLPAEPAADGPGIKVAALPGPELPLPPVAPPPEPGWIVVRSNVSRDRVLIDGEALGPSGAGRHELTPGTHVVRVERSGYQAFEQTIEVESGAKVTVRAMLLAAPARIYRQAKTLFASSSEGDQLQARALVRQAASAGHAEAQFSLGLWLAYRAWQPPAPPEARRSGLRRFFGQRLVGRFESDVFEHEATGSTQDLRKAREEFRKAAEQGHAAAEERLGYLYTSGLGMTLSNPYEGYEWFRKAADAGEVHSQYLAGMMLVLGKARADTQENRAEGIRWLRRAARNGHPDAERALEDKPWR